MNLFVEVFGIRLFSFGGALAIEIGQCKECFGLFGGSLSISIVDIYGCLRIKSLRSAFNGNFYKWHPQPQQESGKFPLKICLLASILFIFGNNVVVKSLKHCKKYYIL